jgi:hypothetical protein
MTPPLYPPRCGAGRGDNSPTSCVLPAASATHPHPKPVIGTLAACVPPGGLGARDGTWASAHQRLLRTRFALCTTLSAHTVPRGRSPRKPAGQPRGPTSDLTFQRRTGLLARSPIWHCGRKSQHSDGGSIRRVGEVHELFLAVLRNNIQSRRRAAAVPVREGRHREESRRTGSPVSHPVAAVRETFREGRGIRPVLSLRPPPGAHRAPPRPPCAWGMRPKGAAPNVRPTDRGFCQQVFSHMATSLLYMRDPVPSVIWTLILSEEYHILFNKSRFPGRT